MGSDPSRNIVAPHCGHFIDRHGVPGWWSTLVPHLMQMQCPPGPSPPRVASAVVVAMSGARLVVAQGLE